ncbi:MAG: DUF4124 domain-containing protein [Pseudoxanthomonas sp.]
MRVLSTSTVLIRSLTLLVLTGVCTTALASKIYQWKDAKGVTHFSDSPPPGGQAKDRRIDNRGEPVPGVAATSKSVENPSCTTAKRNLEVLANKAPVQLDSDGDGKPDKTLSEDDRSAQRSLGEAAVKAYCTPAA